MPAVYVVMFSYNISREVCIKLYKEINLCQKLKWYTKTQVE